MSTMQEEIMVILSKIYGSGISDPKTVLVSNWSNDQFFLCTWIAFDVGVPADIFDQLLSSVDTLYFAGEGFYMSQYGFTQGAYGSGAYVAQEIVAEMKECE